MRKLIGKILTRSDTSANWSKNNPVLGKGECGYATDLRRTKHGDGTTKWNNLKWDDAATANGHTVNADVPAGAKFTDTTYVGATSSSSGLMSASDKSKLDGIGAGANVKSVNGKTGAVTLAKGDVGLGSVANLDQSKAIKSITRSGTTFTATALDGTTTTFTQQDSNTTYGVATSSADGLMSKSDKAKLDGIDPSAITTNAANIKKNADAISAETTRAKAAEKANADTISAEVTRAKKAEEANTQLTNDLKTGLTSGTVKVAKATSADSATALGSVTAKFFYIPDNGARKKYLLFYDISEWISKSKDAGTYAYDGYFFSRRSGGFVSNNYTGTLSMVASYNGMSGSTPIKSDDSQSLRLRTTSEMYKPVILHNTTTNKYYLALETYGNGRDLVLFGIFQGTFLGTWIQNVGQSLTPGTLPDGYELYSEGYVSIPYERAIADKNGNDITEYLVAATYADGAFTFTRGNGGKTVLTIPDAVSNTVNSHIANKSNPHGVTKAQVGLGNVDNTADKDKSVKYATSAGSAGSADTVDGFHEYSFLRYRDATSTNGAETLWNQIGIREYDNALPFGLSGLYSYGAVVSLPSGNVRFDLYYNHQASSNGDGLYYRTGWGTDKKGWAHLIDSQSISSQSVNYANSAGSVAWSNVSGKPSSLPANGGNSATVNGHTVNANVPSGAKFTDTTYGAATQSSPGLMSKSDKAKLDGIASGADVSQIKTVKVNGAALTPDSNKAVNVTVPTLANNATTTTGGMALDARMGKTLSDQILSVKAGAIDQIVNLTTAGWTGDAAPYSQAVNVTGMSSELLCELFSACSKSATVAERKAYNKAYAIVASGYAETADGKVTFSVDKKPAIDIGVRIKSISKANAVSDQTSSDISNAVDAMGNTLEGRVNALTADLAKLYPVGSIYLSVNDTNPATFIGGTWEQIKDRFLLAAGDTYAAGSTGGEAMHTLTKDEMPAHEHVVGVRVQGYSGWDNYTSWDYGVMFKANDTIGYHTPNYTAHSAVVTADTNTGGSGGSQPHNNMPPYLAVYMWKRVS